MILAFSQKINDKPTYFIQKIWYGFLWRKDDICNQIQEYHQKYIEKFKENWDYKDFHHSEKYEKLHTIRKDEKDRWKAGNDIHFCINVRTKNQFQFAPVVKCVSTQKIEIIELIAYYAHSCFQKEKDKPVWIVKVDGKVLRNEEVENLAKNDGFNSVDDFFAYFNTDFTGKIIHWTNLKY